ncbi:MAG: phospholipase [Actinomycetota bacterium]|jgi:phospholipase C
MDRRTFLKATGIGAGLAVGAAGSARAGLANLALPSLGLEGPKARTPVEHIVVVMMENRSVDHYLGWYGAENADFDAIQTAAFPDRRAGGNGVLVPTANWGAAGRADYHGRGYADPSHGWGAGRVERYGGACDGWLDAGQGNDEFALSYYDADDVPVWAQLTRGWQTYDRWFASLLGPTQPNRYYMHSAQSAGRTNNDLPPQVAANNPQWAHGWDWPTIWTLLENKGVSCAYYYCNLPEILFWGERHISHARHISDYYASAAAGQLPQVSFIDPWFIGPEGVACDDHPHADLRLGQTFLSDVVEAFVASANYQSGALVLTYDEWGGFWEHVDPPRVADDRGTPGDPGGNNDFGQLGFRIPSTIVSPWTRRAGAVDHTTYEHVSTLRFISENWDLGYLNTRHRSTNSIEGAFGGFSSFDPDAPFTPYDAPVGLVLEPTLEPYTGQSDLYTLAELGWFDGRGVRTDYRLADAFRRSGVLA